MGRAAQGGTPQHHLKCVHLRNRVGICQRDQVQGAYLRQTVLQLGLWALLELCESRGAKKRRSVSNKSLRNAKEPDNLVESGYPQRFLQQEQEGTLLLRSIFFFFPFLPQNTKMGERQFGLTIGAEEVNENIEDLESMMETWPPDSVELSSL